VSPRAPAPAESVRHPELERSPKPICEALGVGDAIDSEFDELAAGFILNSAIRGLSSSHS
jgi:hypothetical protein